MLSSSPAILAPSPATPAIVNHKSQIVNGFTLVEVLVVVVLMSFIILSLMAVFNSTQAAFRSSLTQSGVLEGGRTVMGLLKNDLDQMSPSLGTSNGAVNFCAITNQYQFQSGAAPLVQSLAASANQRTNVLETFFILTRQNTTWTGVGYVVDTSINANSLNPLYRFSMSTNVSADPTALFNTFLTNLPAWTGQPILPTNASMSHLIDGVVHLTVRPYDINGRWMTNTYTAYTLGAATYVTTNRNALFSNPAWGEVSFYLFSNTLPASVEIDMGLLEDPSIQRAESLSAGSLVQSNYLASRAGQVHLFRQRFPIRNVDPSAYQ